MICFVKNIWFGKKKRKVGFSLGIFARKKDELVIMVWGCCGGLIGKKKAMNNSKILLGKINFPIFHTHIPIYQISYIRPFPDNSNQIRFCFNFNKY